MTNPNDELDNQNGKEEGNAAEIRCESDNDEFCENTSRYKIITNCYKDAACLANGNQDILHMTRYSMRNC